ncbi:hypothetical protein M409DRAFT_67104 [Zasmidium cellare ATCC 36951]|uniref:Cyclin-like domain-containing protein n=1 Tax=Zasmidium cellare ATCC 36951 TaxID=1080233 RepID=A0A6A6CGJ9_ZASCE|nr:uncharacterized protein M409DRAFT_67104 [Zasmidium cellare ATCC 36951]KAF2165773.1 hypothetical protein M409DRAFT_67104 [Zasmidium cellare ATCC 36951]
MTPDNPVYKTCPNPTCGGSNVEEQDGQLVCKDCFTVVAETNIVAEVEFNDEGGGRATVQGASVHENSRHATTFGADTFKRLGGGARNSAAETDRAGKRALAALCPKLGITDDITVQAESIWNMAALNGFTSGRRSDEVAAACLYGACRRRKENTILLMDIAELIEINVFRLGEVYKDMCRELYLADETGVGFQYLVELEPLIFKYCQKLQFGDKTNVVAEDALKIIRRMNRDWIVSGRHPAGLCGACIILAAKMNNFQRSVREVVYVSKVADVTIAKRVEEFRRTKSAALTVNEFREYANRIKYQHDPPSMTLAEERERIMQNKKRKREEHRQSTARDSQAQVPPSQESAPPPQTAPRYDADGFAIPALPQALAAQFPFPIDPALTGEVPSSPEPEQPAKRGRKRKTDKPPEIILSQEELDDEDYLEKDIEAALGNQELEDKRTEVEKAKAVAMEEERIERELKRAQALSEERQKMDIEKNKARREAQDDGDWFGPAPTGVEVTAEELEKEFENDPEVDRCVLQPFEVEVKERIWVAHNEDWLRRQAERELIAKNAPAQSKRKTKKGGKEKTKKKKRGKMGDGSVLTDSATPILTPADAARAMLEKRAPNKSAHVDFSALVKIYGRDTPSRASSSAAEGSGSGSGSGPQSREETPAASRQQSATPAPSETDSQAAPPSRDETPAASRQQSATPAPSEVESQAAEGAAASPEADAGGQEAVENGEEQARGGEEEAEGGEEHVDVDTQVQPATWDNIDEDYYEEEEEEEENDYRRAINADVEEDEFGVVGGGYDSEGEEYE